MRDEEYISRRAHLRSINPMTAFAPPQEEFQALQEQYIEECIPDILERLYGDPEAIQEYILESDYSSQEFQDVCQAISRQMQNPDLDNCVRLTNTLGIFFNKIARKRAIEMEAEL